MSVVLTTYNYDEFISESIDSILAQTYKNFELLIIDDGSTDNSKNIIKTYAKKDKRIKYHYQKNQGQSMARNKVLRYANGKYIIWQDADDIADKTRLAMLANYLEKNPTVGGVGSVIQAIDSDHHKKLFLFGEPFPKNRTRHSLDIIHNYILPGSMMVRKTCLDQVGHFRRFIFAEDKDMLLRLEEQFKIHVMKKILYLYRQHTKSSLHQVLGYKKKKKISRRLNFTLNNLVYLLSAYARRIYNHDPLAYLPNHEPLARARYLFYFIPYPRLYRFIPRIMRINRMSVPEFFLRLLIVNFLNLFNFAIKKISPIKK
ncbi:MAG: glycosyltransferase family 2 protein [Alphaproteobacteria bacterium]